MKTQLIDPRHKGAKIKKTIYTRQGYTILIENGIIKIEEKQQKFFKQNFRRGVEL